ncbi:ATP-binding protein [bacterium]|nr:ATP-binding protein [bacterium]
MASVSASFPRTMESLEHINLLIDAFAHTAELDARTVFAVNLAVEELFTNSVKYVKNNHNPVSISLVRDKDVLVITLIDTDVDRFDIRMREPYNFKKKIEERRVGGLGIPLIHKLMDEVDYHYENRRSIITLRKNLENTYVSDHH